MSNSHFVKGACRHCAGHLEFPAAAAGQTVACPHCGKPTELAPNPPIPRSAPSRGLGRAVALLAGLLVLAAAGAFVFFKKTGPTRVLSSAPPSAGLSAINPPAALPPPPPAPNPGPEPRQTTNDFAILPFKLEQTPGSSLVYVTGSVQNLGSQQRFGVKVRFSLFDSNDLPVGSATDYQSMMEPKSEWRFKALVLRGKVASVQFAGITEQK